MTRETHLRCNRCEDRIGVCRINDTAHLVCHCTHDGGEIDPVRVREMSVLPARWYYA